jgi:hypothetical protein
MRVITSDRVVRWTSGAGLIALGALGWAVFAPGGAFWSAGLVAGLVGTALITAAVVRSRANPTLAQVIDTAEHVDEIGPRPRGERKS